MGIPKFYRYLSERYPLINEIVTSPEFLPECDYLYLDLNGVIHNATHGDGLTKGLPSDEIVASHIIGYISHIFKQIKPKKMLFIAVDGVAPRAKLNQQRSRRYRSALDAQEEREAQSYKGDSFDSNCITPGTEFMDRVDKMLLYMIHKKISEDPLWRDTKVLYSSHSDPGEGEHKIMSFIRNRMTADDYNINERHCIYGLDADLILLSLSLHDVNIILLREIIDFFSFARDEDVDDRALSKSKWQVLHLSMLRMYMLFDLTPVDSSWMIEVDKERLIDDFVFLMILLGDDFLPELPSLDINEGSVQTVVDLYKDIISKMHGFLIEDAKPVIPILHMLLTKLGTVEATVFREREMEEEKQKRMPHRHSQFVTRVANPAGCVPGGLPVIKSETNVQSVLKEAGEVNFRTIYYYAKLNIVLPHDQNVLDDMCRCYYEGLQWIFLYYYRGVPSWSWYYPYHYSPLATDLAVYNMKYKPFKMMGPFSPFLQQLGCLPPQSSSILPSSYRRLVMDPKSPIFSFYPSTFSVDMNGKHNPWEGVNLIPFIDERLIRQSLTDFECDALLSNAEKTRNEFRPACLFSYCKHPSTKIIPSPVVNSTLLMPVINYCEGVSYSIPQCQTKQENILHLTALPGTACIEGDYRIHREDIHIVNTGRVSKQPTVVIDIPPRITGKNITTTALTQIAKNCHNRLVQYSFHLQRYARIDGLFTRQYYVSTNPNVKGEYVVIPHQPEIAEKMDQICDNMQNNSLHGETGVVGLGGVDLKDVQLLVSLSPIIGMHRNPATGHLVPRFASQIIFYPFELVKAVNSIADPRMKVLQDAPLNKRVKLRQTVVFMGNNKVGMTQLFGSRGVVERVDGNSVDVILNMAPMGVEMGHVVLRSQYREEKWYSAGQLATMLQINVFSLLKVAGYYTVIIGNDRTNIGLELFNRDRMIPEYVQCRRTDVIEYNESHISALPYCPLSVPMTMFASKLDEWKYSIEFSSAALHILMNYRNRYPALFERIRDTDGSPAVDDLFPGHRKEILRDVTQWVENLPHHEENTMSSRSVCCSKKQAKNIEKIGNSMRNSEELNGMIEPVRIRCAANQIAFWEHDEYTDSLTELYCIPPLIGDRMVIIAGNDVPFGEYGYVVAIHPETHMVETVMDVPFIGGTNLHGLLDVEGRGAVVEWEKCLFIKSVAMKVGSGTIL